MISEPDSPDYTINSYSKNSIQTNRVAKASAAYFLVSYVEAVGNGILADQPESLAYILGAGILGAMIGGAFSLLVFGVLWFWIASRIMKGTTRLKETVIIVGENFYKPALFSLTCIPFLIFLHFHPDSVLILSISTLIALFCGFWALIRAIKSVKAKNEFNWKQTLFISIWPILLFTLASILFELIL